MADHNIRNENLRLVMSKNHLDWLEKEQRDRRNAFRIMLGLFALSIIWIAVSFSADPPPPNTVYVSANESQEVIETLEADGYHVIVGRTRDDGTVEPVSFLEEYGLMGIIAALVSALFAARAYYELRRINHWQANHEAFLREHGHKVPDKSGT